MECQQRIRKLPLTEKTDTWRSNKRSFLTLREKSGGRKSIAPGPSPRGRVQALRVWDSLTVTVLRSLEFWIRVASVIATQRALDASCVWCKLELHQIAVIKNGSKGSNLTGASCISEKGGMKSRLLPLRLLRRFPFTAWFNLSLAFETKLGLGTRGLTFFFLKKRRIPKVNKMLIVTKRHGRHGRPSKFWWYDDVFWQTFPSPRQTTGFGLKR